MGGKGIRRRERNYRAAHGGYERLPPPPDASKVDALPSKLRKIFSFTSSRTEGSEKVSKDAQERHKRAEKKSHPKDVHGSTNVKDGGNGGKSKVSQLKDSDDDIQSKSSEKKSRKRKRKQVDDLRFETTLENSDRRLKKRERRKKLLIEAITRSASRISRARDISKRYLEAKKNKRKKGKTEEDLDFPRHEKVRFGDVVEAPPKLVVPKAFKAHDASQERRRLQAIDAYRNRKGWSSRPGIELPSLAISPAL